jgi:hypothetical protein
MIGIPDGIFLWLLTLVPIHKPITGFSPWNHPFGRLPALASLGGHVVYGIVLGNKYLLPIRHTRMFRPSHDNFG